LLQVGDIPVTFGDFLDRRVKVRFIVSGKDSLVANGKNLLTGLASKHDWGETVQVGLLVKPGVCG
jgi:hypothetical protein